MPAICSTWMTSATRTTNSDAACRPHRAACGYMSFRLRIGSRPSALAFVQANLIKARIEKTLPGITIEIVAVSTSGDKLTTASLARIGGKGLFIRELEQALSDRRIDLAVHSMKDLPAVLPPEYRLAAVPHREDP